MSDFGIKEPTDPFKFVDVMWYTMHEGKLERRCIGRHLDKRTNTWRYFLRVSTRPTVAAEWRIRFERYSKADRMQLWSFWSGYDVSLNERTKQARSRARNARALGRLPADQWTPASEVPLEAISLPTSTAHAVCDPREPHQVRKRGTAQSRAKYALKRLANSIPPKDFSPLKFRALADSVGINEVEPEPVMLECESTPPPAYGALIAWTCPVCSSQGPAHYDGCTYMDPLI